MREITSEELFPLLKHIVDNDGGDITDEEILEGHHRIEWYEWIAREAWNLAAAEFGPAGDDKARAIAQAAYGYVHQGEQGIADGTIHPFLAPMLQDLRNELDRAADADEYRPCICFETPHLDLLRSILMVDGDADYADSVLGEWQAAIDRAKNGSAAKTDYTGVICWDEAADRWSMKCSEHGEIFRSTDGTADAHDDCVRAWERHCATVHGERADVDFDTWLLPHASPEFIRPAGEELAESQCSRCGGLDGTHIYRDCPAAPGAGRESLRRVVDALADGSQWPEVPQGDAE